MPDDPFSPTPGFRIDFGEETRFTADGATFELMRTGLAQRKAQEQFLVLDMLVEEGRAFESREGFVVPAAEIARLDDEEATILGLPPRFAGDVHTRVHRWTSSPDFRVDLELTIGPHPVLPERRGPVVNAGGSRTA